MKKAPKVPLLIEKADTSHVASLINALSLIRASERVSACGHFIAEPFFIRKSLGRSLTWGEGGNADAHVSESPFSPTLASGMKMERNAAFFAETKMTREDSS